MGHICNSYQRPIILMQYLSGVWAYFYIPLGQIKWFWNDIGPFVFTKPLYQFYWCFFVSLIFHWPLHISEDLLLESFVTISCFLIGINLNKSNRVATIINENLLSGMCISYLNAMRLYPPAACCIFLLASVRPMINLSACYMAYTTYPMATICVPINSRLQ